MDPPPTNQIFASRDVAQQHCQDWARDHGYALVVRNSKRRQVQNVQNGEIYWVRLNCDRGGAPRRDTNHTRQRRTATSKINCPFGLALQIITGTTDWELRVLCSTHTHAASAQIAQHTILRQAERAKNAEIMTTIRTNQIAGITPRNTYNALQLAQIGKTQTLKDVHNAYQRTRQQSNELMRPIQAMMHRLGDDYWFNYELDDDHCLIRLAFIHKQTTRELTRRFPYALVTDITYSTNRFGLYLLNIVGITATNRSFVAGQALLMSEDTRDITWALQQYKQVCRAAQIALPSSMTSDRSLAILNAVSAVFGPDGTQRLICQWHITRDVRAYIIRYFRNRPSVLATPFEEEINTFLSQWARVQYAKTAIEYDVAWETLVTLYSDTHQPLIGYLCREWLPYRQMFIPAWTNQITHFGNASSNRVEGIHHAIKRQFTSPNQDLQQLADSLRLYAQTAANEATEELNQNRQRSAFEFIAIPAFTALHSVISNYAIRRVKEHWSYVLALLAKSGNDKSRVTPVTCTGVFTRIHGMPCGHVIHAMQGAALAPNAFHNQWRLDISAELPAITEFMLIRDPKRKVKRRRLGNKREPSAVEYEDKELAALTALARAGIEQLEHGIDLT